MSRLHMPRTATVEAVVGATRQQVYDVVTDVTRVGEWSHECRSSAWVDGSSGPAIGARFRGTSQASWAKWSRTCTITELDPGRRFAYETSSPLHDRTRWTFDFTDGPSGTTVRQTYLTLSFPRWLELLILTIIPAHRDREDALRADLVRLGQVAAEQRAGVAGAP